VLLLLAAIAATAVLAGDATVVGQWRDAVVHEVRQQWESLR
jgi:hypothetical protein